MRELEAVGWLKNPFLSDPPVFRRINVSCCDAAARMCLGAAFPPNTLFCALTPANDLFC